MWAALINAGLGIWLMAAPAILGYGQPAMTNDRIVGPIAATCATIAAWEATRSLRWANLPLGLWMLVAPLVLGYTDLLAVLNSFAVGAALALLAAVRGKHTGRYAGGWSSLWRGVLHEQERTEKQQ